MVMVRQKFRVFALVVFLIAAFVFALTYTPKEFFYYRSDENYVTVDAEVEGSAYSSKNATFSVWFPSFSRELGVPPERLTFRILAANLPEEMFSALEDALRPSSRIRFRTAPRYFGDGYLVPIVAVETDGQTVLPEDVGRAILMKMEKTNLLKEIAGFAIALAAVNAVGFFVIRRHNKKVDAFNATGRWE